MILFQRIYCAFDTTKRKVKAYLSYYLNALIKPISLWLMDTKCFDAYSFRLSEKKSSQVYVYYLRHIRVVGEKKVNALHFVATK